jgi:hypothetical protein
MFSFQYTFFNQLNFFLRWLPVTPFMRPTTSLTAYFGGITITRCKWSLLMFLSTISHPGIIPITFGKSFSRYALTPGFRMRRRYWGIQTIWYSPRYTLCPENSVFMHTLYPIAAALIHPRAEPVELCPSGRVEWNFYCPIDATAHRSYSNESSEHGTNNRFSSLRKSFPVSPRPPIAKNHSSPLFSSIRRPICKEIGARNEPASLQKN